MNLNIYISDYAKTKVLQLPIIPSEMPSLSSKSSNEEFETWWDGSYNFIEKKGLLTLNLDSWLPLNASKYSFCKSKVNASEIIALIQNAQTKAEPIRLVVTGDTTYNLNDTFSIESFDYNILKRGDYKYTLSLKQFREYTTTITSTDWKLGWNQDNVGWWYVTNLETKEYYKDCWQLIENAWYSFNAKGYARKTEWQKDGLYWYYLKDSCKMAFSEWVQTNSKWYYLGNDGAMWTNGYSPEGYWLGEDGAWVK